MLGILTVLSLDSFCYAKAMDKIPFEQLIDMVVVARGKVNPGSTWQHYKGTQCIVRDVAVMESGNEPAVVYSDTRQPDLTFIRPLSEWFQILDWNGEPHQRFTAVN
jgi:hypothetical protein